MSTTTLRGFADGLSERDRRFLRGYLLHLERADKPAHRRKLGAAMRRMEAGRKTSVTDLKRLLRTRPATEE